MFNLIRINNQASDKQIQQLFISFYGKNLPRSSFISLSSILVDHRPSLVAYCDEHQAILKLIKPRKYHEIVKQFWGHSRLFKEVKGNYLLKGLGLNTPNISDVAYAFLPSKNFEYLGYYIMEDLSKNNLTEVFETFSNKTSTDAHRLTLLENISDGLITMKENNIVFTDFTLGNVFANDNGDITWIDTGVSKFNKQLDKKFDQAVKRFIRIHQTLFTNSETAYLTKKLSL